uniref:Outer capsid protein VP2 n=1 Tax=Wallal virus TaxID=40061 RepID=A0A097I4D0_9REOV|nr:VP2 [Wallal virus]
MASEMTIAVTDEMKEENHRIYQHYDVVVETSYRAKYDEEWFKRKNKKVWSLKDETQRNALHVGDVDLEFDDIWNLKPKDSTVLISSEHLKHAIVAYQAKVLEHGIPDIYRNMVQESIENQMVNPGKTDLAGRITVDTLFGRTHLWGSMAESMCYERKGVEVWQSCDHDNSNLIDQLYLIGLYSIRHNPYYYIPWEDFVIREKANLKDELGFIGKYDKSLTLGKINKEYYVFPNIKQTAKELFNMDASWDYNNAKNKHLTRFWDQPKEYLSKEENCVKLVDALRKVAEDLKVNFVMTDTPGICEHFSKILADTFRMDVYGSQRFSQIPTRKKFAANLVRAADQMCGYRLTPTTREKCLQGVYQIAQAMLGPIYKKMASEMNYKVEDFMKSYQSEANKNKLFRVMKTNQRISFLERKNVYIDLPKGRHQGITWASIYKKPTVDFKVDMRKGDPFQYCDQEDGDALCASFNDEYYYIYMDQILEKEKWDDQIDDLSSLLNQDGNILKYDVSTDFYLSDDGELKLADYYRKKVIFGLIRGHEFECIDTYSENYNIAHKGSKRLDHDEIFYGIEGLIRYGCHRFDSTSLGEGKLLERPSFAEVSGGVMAMFSEYMTKQQWFISRFCKGKKCSEDAEELAWCNSYTVSRYLTWEYAMYVFSLFKNFAPIAMRKMLTKEFESVIPVIDENEMPEIIFEITHIVQIPVMIVDFLFENKRILRNANQCLRILLELQNMVGDRRILLLKKTFPVFFSTLQKANPDGIFALNFLPYILNFNLTGVPSCSNRVVPLAYCDAAKLRILPVTLMDYEGMGKILNWTNYLTRFYGLDDHEKMEIGDELKMILPWLVDYYMMTSFLRKPENIIELSTKRQLIEMWLGQRCGGVSEALTFIRSSHFPTRGFVLISIGDGLISMDKRIEIAKRRFEGSGETLIGTVCVEVRGESVKIHTQGVVEARILQRIFWGVKHKVVIIKSRGRVFGNELMVTKLMNL